MDTATPTCLDCGDPAPGRGARGLCARCYSVNYRRGTLDRYPRRRRSEKPPPRRPVAATCAGCGAAFARQPDRLGPRAYCSRRCALRAGGERRGPAPDAAAHRARCDRAAAALRAEIRARRAAGRSLVLADRPAFVTAAPAAVAAA